MAFDDDDPFGNFPTIWLLDNAGDGYIGNWKGGNEDGIGDIGDFFGNGDCEGSSTVTVFCLKLLSLFSNFLFLYCYVNCIQDFFQNRCFKLV